MAVRDQRSYGCAIAFVEIYTFIYRLVAFLQIKVLGKVLV